MQKEVGGKNMRPGGVPSVKGQLAAAVFTWFLQLHLHPEHSRVSSEAEIETRKLGLGGPLERLFIFAKEK